MIIIATIILTIIPIIAVIVMMEIIVILTRIITTIAVIIPIRSDCIYCFLHCSFWQKNDFLLCVCKY